MKQFIEPTAEEVKAEREKFDIGIVEARKKLLRVNVEKILYEMPLPWMREPEKTLRACLLAMLKGGLV